MEVSGAKERSHRTGWITISLDEHESMQRTIETLSDEDLMGQIRDGRKEGVKVRDSDL